jgi:hypothetical protein
MAAIEIVPVDGLWRFAAFCRLPRLLYTGQKGFAPPLDAERWANFGHKLNPHFRLVEAREFLARSGRQWVGRIAAQIYKPQITPVSASRAQFGALDAIDDIAVTRALTEAAEEWLRAGGATRVNGPFSPSINGEAGLLIEGFEARPMIFMPWNPPYLARHLDALGYVKARDLYSYRFAFENFGLGEKPRMANRREWQDRLKLRPLKLDQLKKGETALMSELFNDAWRGNWGFVPYTVEELNSSADLLKYIISPEYGIVAELDGVPQSFAIALPNLHEITADLNGRLFPFGIPRVVARIRKHKFEAARIVLLGTRKALQNSAAGGALLLAMIEEFRRRGASASIKHLEVGWVLEDNLAMRRPIELFGGKADKVHRVYEKQLQSAGGQVAC